MKTSAMPPRPSSTPKSYGPQRSPDMLDLLLDAVRRDGFGRTVQRWRVKRRWVAGGGMLDCCELNSMTWVRGLRTSSDGMTLARLRADRARELDQTKRTAPHSVPLKR